MLKVDFHTHTHYSGDSLTRIDVFLNAARKRGLGKVAVTDHNSIKGAIEAYAIAPEMVIIGEEIKTTKGELLGYFLEEMIEPYLEPIDAIQRLKAQNAFISISHPFDHFRSGWTREELIQIAPYVDGIETFNARCFTKEMNHNAERFAKEYRLERTAGSDAHAPQEIGNAVVLMPNFTNAEEMRAVIRDGRVEGKITGFWVRFYSLYAKMVKRFPGLWKNPKI